jgi:hypothetical protein
MSTVDQTLSERGAKYGKFQDHATITQDLEDKFYSHYVMIHNSDKELLPPYIVEGLHMIFHKLGRLANGDIMHEDSWLDIAGYAVLIANILQRQVELKTPNDKQ